MRKPGLRVSGENKSFVVLRETHVASLRSSREIFKDTKCTKDHNEHKVNLRLKASVNNEFF